MLSFLEIVVKADSSPYRVRQELYEFLTDDGEILGKVLPFVASTLGEFEDVFVVDKKSLTLQMQPFKSPEARSQGIARVMHQLRSDKVFEVLEGWRDELYPVYVNKRIYFLVERSGACLLGLVTYGVHINGYVPASRPQDYKLWIPRRSYSKPTFPGMLDNTIAGGLGHPHGPWDTCLKESSEEAGLDPDYTAKNLTAVGVLTYEFIRENSLDKESGVFQPECEYIYDLVFDENTKPHPEDGEVHEFTLMSVEEVKQHLQKGEFKYNCGLVLVDFFIRHGIITPDNEKNYLEIVQRCHRALPYPLR